MSQSLKSMSKEEQMRAIMRRLKRRSGGLGYLSAVGAKKKVSA